jgi:type IV pilus assembly protein PilQ
MSATWRGAPIAEVLRAFAAFSGASIVAGAGVEGFVNADINDQPWDVALLSILTTRGLVGIENASGIIRVEAVANVGSREVIEPIVTRSYRISYSRAAELQAAIASLLSSRGGVSIPREYQHDGRVGHRARAAHGRRPPSLGRIVPWNEGLPRGCAGYS